MQRESSIVATISSQKNIVLCTNFFAMKITRHLIPKFFCATAFFTPSNNQCMKFIEMLDSKDAFFQTQILINAKKERMRIAEVKVNYEYPRKKGSKISVVKDGVSMFSQILKEYGRQRKR